MFVQLFLHPIIMHHFNWSKNWPCDSVCHVHWYVIMKGSVSMTLFSDWPRYGYIWKTTSRETQNCFAIFKRFLSWALNLSKELLANVTIPLMLPRSVSAASHCRLLGPVLPSKKKCESCWRKGGVCVLPGSFQWEAAPPHLPMSTQPVLYRRGGGRLKMPFAIQVPRLLPLRSCPALEPYCIYGLWIKRYI